MHDMQILWAQAAQEGEIYKIAGVDNEGTLSMVWDLETAERMEHVLKKLKVLLKKYTIDQNTEWWNDLDICVDFMRFMVPRQREAKELHESKINQRGKEADVAMPRQTISTPYCSDEHILGPQHQLWKSFLSKLKGPAGVRFALSDGKATWYCNHSLVKTTAILNEYIIDGIDTQATLEFFREYGGTCDCKVLFDVMENFYHH